MDVAKAVSEIKSGKVEYRVDKVGNIHVSVGKVSFDDEKLVEIATCYYRFSLEQKNYFDIINYFLSSPKIFFEPDLKTRIDMSGRKILAAIRDIVSEGVARGVFTERYPEKFSVMFWAALHGLIHFRKLEKTTLGNESIEQFYEYSVHKLISGIRQ